MVDFWSPGDRSKHMAKIGSKDTRPELALRRALHKQGLRFRLHAKQLPGKPDLTFPRFKTIVFVHGCFWHRHLACSVASVPKSNTEYWLDKFNKNIKRDREVKQKLEALGWRVIVVWECELRSRESVIATSQALAAVIRKV